MTRFKKELIKRNVMLEETLPCLPYDNIDSIVVHADTSTVSYYDYRVGWYHVKYNRNMTVKYDTSMVKVDTQCKFL